MVRFMSKGCEHGDCGVIITRWGTDITDPAVIEQLRHSPSYGNLFFEVEDADAIHKKTVAFAKEILANEPDYVAPISGISKDEMEAEVAAAEENSRLKKEREQEEEALWNERKEEHDNRPARKRKKA